MVVVHAAWCGDCQYTMPLVKKIILAIPEITVVDVEVDRQKQDPKGLA